MLSEPIEDQRIGFVGLGTMGMPMAKNALAGGFSVIGYDVREPVVDDFVDAGGDGADDLAALSRDCRVVCIVVQNDEQVTDVLAGEGGLFDGFEATGEESIVLVNSTVHPETPRTLAEAAPATVTLLDAPVSGVRLRAETGELSFMVGGDADAFEYCLPLLERMGTNFYHLGPVGSGEVAKLANNLVSLSNMMSTAEGIRIGTEWGLDREQLLAVMGESSADSFILDNWEWMTDGWEDVQPGGFEGIADVCAKDLELALKLAKDLHTEVPGAAVASQRVPAFFRGLADE